MIAALIWERESVSSSPVLSPFQYAFVQRGVLELLLLAVPAGLLGVWIVLRGLAFYSHGVGAAAVFALGVERFTARRRSASDTATALVLVGALALGIILASDVFHSGAHVESL